MRKLLPILLVLPMIAVGTCLSLSQFSTTLIPLQQQLALARDVPFVPTRDEVVNEMLNALNITDADILYDLGCGDGRIVITAAKRFGIKGVGIDIDPERIRESKANAEKAGVTDKVKFIIGDLYEADFKEASVLTLYLLPDVNLNLRPRIFEQVRPGTRVVSHDFDMGDWHPDKRINVPGKRDVVYYWVVPANVSGVWEWTESKEAEKMKLRLTQSFQKVKGSLTRGSVSTPISDAVLSGDQLSFSVGHSSGTKNTPLKFQGKVKGNTIEGIVAGQGATGQTAWKAERDGSTVVVLDRTRSRQK
jgi:SAM-dependent methyltransferase